MGCHSLYPYLYLSISPSFRTRVCRYVGDCVHDDGGHLVWRPYGDNQPRTRVIVARSRDRRSVSIINQK